LERDDEDKVKGHVIGEGRVLEEYRVKANFTRSAGRKYLKSEDLIPNSLTLTAEYLDQNGKRQSLFNTPTLTVDLPPDTRLGFVREYVDMSKDNAKKLDTIPRVSPELASAIIRFRGKNAVDEMKDDPYVKLFSA
jgi:hypothetical protein